MQYRRLGKTGFEVSALSFGASSLGSEFREVDEDEGVRTVHTALDLGINYIDVAPYYGRTTAERVLGAALADIDRDRYYLATKVGRHGTEDFDFSAGRVTRSVDESLNRLGTEYVDVIQCHDIEFADLNQIVNETLPALEKVRDAGKARFIGITGLPLNVFREVLGRNGAVDTILSYCRYTLFDQSLETLLPSLLAKDLGVVNASPLSMRLLSDRGAPDWHPADAEVRETCAKAAAHCRERGESIAQLAVQFCVANDEIHTTVVGTANPEHIRQNVEWAEKPMNRELLEEVQAILAPIRNRTWKSGRLENNDPETPTEGD